MGLGFFILWRKQQVGMVSTHCNVKKCLFLKLTCEVMEKEQDFIFGREKGQTVWNTQKIFFSFLRLGRPAPKFRQTCTITQKQFILRGFKCDFWIHSSFFNAAILRSFTTYVKS